MTVTKSKAHPNAPVAKKPPPPPLTDTPGTSGLSSKQWKSQLVELGHAGALPKSIATDERARLLANMSPADSANAMTAWKEQVQAGGPNVVPLSGEALTQKMAEIAARPPASNSSFMTRGIVDLANKLKLGAQPPPENFITSTFANVKKAIFQSVPPTTTSQLRGILNAVAQAAHPVVASPLPPPLKHVGHTSHHHRPHHAHGHKPAVAQPAVQTPAPGTPAAADSASQLVEQLKQLIADIRNGVTPKPVDLFTPQPFGPGHPLFDARPATTSSDVNAAVMQDGQISPAEKKALAVADAAAAAANAVLEQAMADGQITPGERRSINLTNAALEAANANVISVAGAAPTAAPTTGTATAPATAATPPAFPSLANLPAGVSQAIQQAMAAAAAAAANAANGTPAPTTTAPATTTTAPATSSTTSAATAAPGIPVPGQSYEDQLATAASNASDPANFHEATEAELNNMTEGQMIAYQAKMQKHARLMDMYSKLLQAQNDMKKGIIGNFRV
jgi:hypothetical protein